MKKKNLKNTLLVLLFSATGYIISLPLTLWQYQKNSQKIFKKIEEGDKPALYEKLSIYGLNLTIGIAALPIYTEVAKETLYLCMPVKNNERIFESDFFLKSKVIQQAIKENKKRVAWNRENYAFDKNEARYALALNACDLEITRNETTIEYKVVVEVEYPKKREAVLFNRPLKISVEEGLFGYLQDIGWLHPYKAIWKYSEPVDTKNE